MLGLVLQLWRDEIGSFRFGLGLTFFAPRSPVVISDPATGALLLENGDYLLLEGGDKLLLG